MKKTFVFLLSAIFAIGLSAQEKTLHQLQQDFVNLRFGMFIHYNIPTYSPDDWPDPDLPASVFNPTKLDCSQWAKAAKSANMSYGCLTTKHHSGFCLWDTQTTDYNVMNSPYKKDVVKQYADAFRKEGLKVMLYYSILDTHHRLRANMIKPEHISMIKAQLKELLTSYGEITAIIIDGWDAPWSRISYDEIPFEEIYNYIKSIQPNCLVMDLNAAKYPREALFYTDIKSYEQGAGQKISTTENKLPALACLSIQRTWFWKETFPQEELKSPSYLVNENIIPYNKAYCNFILNVAPNRDGLMDDNALEALKEIGRLFKPQKEEIIIPDCQPPITGHNIAKNKPCESSWSWDMNIMDFANDDNFSTSWQSNKHVSTPFWQVDLEKTQKIDMIVLTEQQAGVIQQYSIEYFDGRNWISLFDGNALTDSRVKIHRFKPVTAQKVRITIKKSSQPPALCEVGVYAAQ